MERRQRNFNAVFGAHVRALRQGLQWTLAEMCRRISDTGGTVDITTLSRIERGLHGISLYEAVIIARALAVPLSRLYMGMGDVSSGN
jgi:transcriptional regulator with XRE-family HTH domain